MIFWQSWGKSQPDPSGSLVPYTYLDIKVEHGPLATPDKMTDLKLKLEKKIKETLNFKGVVELVKPDTIERTAMGKARRVIRKY